MSKIVNGRTGKEMEHIADPTGFLETLIAQLDMWTLGIFL
jgi:hypothetical protein